MNSTTYHLKQYLDCRDAISQSPLHQHTYAQGGASEVAAMVDFSNAADWKALVKLYRRAGVEVWETIRLEDGTTRCR
jgi:hypothetical protein